MEFTLSVVLLSLLHTIFHGNNFKYFSFVYFLVCQPSLQPADIKHGGLQKCFLHGEKRLEASSAYTTGGSVIPITIRCLVSF